MTDQPTVEETANQVVRDATAAAVKGLEQVTGRCREDLERWAEEKR